MKPSHGTWRFAAALAGVLGFLAPVPASNPQSDKIRSLRDAAELHERNFDWDKAVLAYDALLRLQRDLPGLKERYQAALRRYWQACRHRDESFRREALSLDYGQALRLYNKVRDVLLDQALDRKKTDPARLLRKGIEELDAALADPFFCQLYLPPGKQAEVPNFRRFLKRVLEPGALSRLQIGKKVREIALAAQNNLELNATVALMELAAGACHAVDEFTGYLTPSQLRELCDSLKGETEAGVLLPSVHHEMKTGEIGYVQITNFQDTTLQELDAALLALQNKNLRGLVLDLRGNGGGLFEVAIDVARRFLTTGVIASTENQDAKFNAVYQSRNPGAFGLPMIVLIDGDTASAAEVLAGALQENDRAKLVGQPTFGKGCTQCLVKLPAAIGGIPTGGIRLTIARFFSPKGQSYSGQGIIPDVLVERFKPEGMMMAEMLDQQLVEAVGLLQKQMRRGGTI